MELDWRQVFIRKQGLFVLEFRELFRLAQGVDFLEAYHKLREKIIGRGGAMAE
jgi:hypothetical protein